MAKRKYSVAYEGHVFTRTTERTYTHIVIVQTDIDLALQQARDNAECRCSDENWAYHVRENNPATRMWKHADSVLQNIAKIVVYGSRDAWLAAEREEKEAAVRDAYANGSAGGWGAASWCGRPDLATKEADKLRRYGHFSRVKIIPIPAEA